MNVLKVFENKQMKIIPIPYGIVCLFLILMKNSIFCIIFKDFMLILEILEIEQSWFFTFKHYFFCVKYIKIIKKKYFRQLITLINFKKNNKETLIEGVIYKQIFKLL